MKNRIVILLLCALVTLCGCHNNKKYADLPEELAALCKSIDKHPKNSELYYQRANYYYMHKDVDKGIADMQTAVKLQPDSSKYYIMLSDLYFAQVETDLAEEMLEKAIQKDPKNNEARLKLAELFYHENLLTQCNETLDEAIKQQKYNPKAYLIKAFMYKDMLFTIDQIIAYVSKFITLRTGDIIFTGTPVGVGPVHINDHLEGFLEDEKMFEFNVK